MNVRVGVDEELLKDRELSAERNELDLGRHDPQHLRSLILKSARSRWTRVRHVRRGLHDARRVGVDLIGRIGHRAYIP